MDRLILIESIRSSTVPVSFDFFKKSFFELHSRTGSGLGPGQDGISVRAWIEFSKNPNNLANAMTSILEFALIKLFVTSSSNLLKWINRFKDAFKLFSLWFFRFNRLI